MLDAGGGGWGDGGWGWGVGRGEGSRQLGRKNYTRSLGELHKGHWVKTQHVQCREMEARRTVTPGAEAMLCLCPGTGRCGRCRGRCGRCRRSLQLVVRGLASVRRCPGCQVHTWRVW